MKKVCVILVNYNSADLTIKCINSIRQSMYENISIVIVDNASRSSDIKLLSQIDNCKCIFLDSNKGYAHAVNCGIQYAIGEGAEFYLILNNDTILSSGFIGKMVENATDDTIVVPKIMYLNNPDTIWYAGGKIDYSKGIAVHYGYNKKDDKKYQIEKYVDFACGCSMFFSNKVYSRLGPLDEEYFLYYEDVDYSIRAKLENIHILYCPEAVLFHSVSASTGHKSALSIYYSTRNRFFLMKKYSFCFGAWLYSLCTRMVYFLLGLVGKRAYLYVFWGIRDFLLGKMKKAEYFTEDSKS